MFENKTSNDLAITTSTGPSAKQISLSDYSDTAVYAANKALPSIVGIQVEFTVNSYFTRNQTFLYCLNNYQLYSNKKCFPRLVFVTLHCKFLAFTILSKISLCS